ncbi:MAG: glycosyltransferase [Legionellaceae bacterium]|nr:glycosyltransferase [Legionellaceae bacterium]
MKILHVYKTFINDTMGGVEQVIANLVKTGNSSDYDHSVLSLSKKSPGIDASFAGVNNLHYKEQFSIASNAFSLPLLYDFRNVVNGYDLIHYHFPWPFADMMHIFCRIKKPSIVTYHSDIVRQKKLRYLYNPLMHRFLSSVNMLVATSPNYLETSTVLQRYQNKTAVVPIGISKRNYPKPSQEKTAYWQNRFGKRFFLFVGVMRYYKGLHILLDAIQGAMFPVVIVGTGPIEDSLKRQANDLNVTNVHFLGKLPDEDKIALLQLCSSVVFPSHLRSEAFGVSLLEGAMFGKPMISTEIGTGTSYINIDGTTGLVVPPSDPQALRRAMDFIWTHPEESSVMGDMAAARHKILFTGNKMVAEYEKLYEKVVVRHGAV